MAILFPVLQHVSILPPTILCLDKDVQAGLFHQQRAVKCSDQDPPTPEGPEARSDIFGMYAWFSCS